MQSRKKAKNILLYIVAGCLITFGALGLLSRYQATHGTETFIPTHTVTHTNDEPAETAVVEACDSYIAPDDEPRKIELPSIGVSGCVIKVGTDQHKAIAAPPNVHLAGWYVKSAKPGEQGVSVIDGHVSGRYTDGIFKSLHKLHPGDTVRVQLGNGEWREFAVETSDSYSSEQSVKELLQPLPDVKTQLSLITCTGPFDKQTNTYVDRLVVKARLR